MKKLTKKQKRDILRMAKRLFISPMYDGIGMCYAINEALRIYVGEQNLFAEYKYKGYESLHDWFPQFNPDYLCAQYYKGVEEEGYRNRYWWVIYDKKSRISAFNKLIKLYV